MSDPNDYKLDIAGLSNSQPGPAAAATVGRPFLRVQFACCNVYQRIYRSLDEKTYQGRCPRCGNPVRFVVGSGGNRLPRFYCPVRQIAPNDRAAFGTRSAADKRRCTPDLVCVERRSSRHFARSLLRADLIVTADGGVEDPAEIAAADFADFVRGEALLEHLFNDGVKETHFLVSPQLVGSLANPGAPRATAGATTCIRGAARRSAGIQRRRQFCVSADADVIAALTESTLAWVRSIRMPSRLHSSTTPAPNSVRPPR